jgi:hypothetical protein
MDRREVWKHFDYWLFGTVILLCVFWRGHDPFSGGWEMRPWHHWLRGK